MAKEVIMPALGMAQETGTLLAWLKKEGETITKGEPLMTVATDKTDVEIEAPASGILRNVTLQVGQDAPVGQVIAWILAPGETAPTAKGTAVAVAPSPTAADAIITGAVAATPVAARMAAEHNIDLRQLKASGDRIQKEDVLAYLAENRGQGAGGRVLASPKARRLAQEKGLELAAINGSGPEGAVLAADVLTAQQQTIVIQAEPLVAPIQPVAPMAPITQSPNALPMSRAWRIMAQRLQQSWTTVPHFYLERDVNARRLVQWRNSAQQRLGAQTTVKITYTDLLVKLIAAALRKHPRLNASWQGEAIITNDAINIGLAVAVEDGLLVPVVQGADQLGLVEIATRRADLVEKAQTGKLVPADLANGTFTMSNLGMYGVDRFNAIVNPPQAAILAVGAIADRVVPVDGQPSVQPMLTLTLSCDHRVVDGARAAQFLQALVAGIEDPLAILD